MDARGRPSKWITRRYGRNHEPRARRPRFRYQPRNPDRNEALERAAARVSESLPGAHRVEIGRGSLATGAATSVVSVAAPAAEGDYIRRALDHVQAIAPAFGLEEHAPEFVADPVVQKTSSGRRAVNLQQRYRGIPVFHAAAIVRFAPDGTIVDTVGSPVSPGSNGLARRRGSGSRMRCCGRRSTSRHRMRTSSTRSTSSGSRWPPRGRPQRVRAEGASGVPERSRAPDDARPGPVRRRDQGAARLVPARRPLDLAWQVLLTIPDYEGQYVTVVDASSGDDPLLPPDSSRPSRPSATCTASTAARRARGPSSRAPSATTACRFPPSARRTGGGATSARASTSPATRARTARPAARTTRPAAATTGSSRTRPRTPGRRTGGGATSARASTSPATPARTARPAARTTRPAAATTR